MDGLSTPPVGPPIGAGGGGGGGRGTPPRGQSGRIGEGTPQGGTTIPVSTSPVASARGEAELETEPHRRDSSLVNSPENSYASGAWNGDDATESVEIKLRREMDELKKQLEDSRRLVKGLGFKDDFDSGYEKEWKRKNRAWLDEKYFRRIGDAERFKGDKVDAGAFNTYLFDLMNCCNQADKELGSVLRKFMGDVSDRS